MLNYFILFFQDIELSIIHFGLPVVFPGPKNATCIICLSSYHVERTNPNMLSCRIPRSFHHHHHHKQWPGPRISRVNSRSGMHRFIILPQTRRVRSTPTTGRTPVTGRPHRCKDLLLASVPTSLRQSPSSANSLDRPGKTPQKTACDDLVERQGLDTGHWTLERAAMPRITGPPR